MLGPRVGSSMLRLPVVARLPLRPAPFQCPHDLSARVFSHSALRLFATRGRPKKAVGEPSKPVKRAVKRTAKSTTASSTEPAKSKIVAKKKTTATKKKAPKPKAKPKPKKVLTEEQKARASARTAKAKITQLKKAALSPPSISPRKANAYIMLVQDKLKGTALPSGDAERKAAFRDRVREVGDEYKHLSPAELEHYNHLAVQQFEANAAEHKRWVESHTPEEIQKANQARATLRRLLKPTLKGSGARKWNSIKDERAVKRPISSYLQFSINRQASGDFTRIPVTERAKLIAQEWKELNAAEKKKYEALHHQDQDRYETDYKDVYGHVPPSLHNGQRQAAAAAG